MIFSLNCCCNCCYFHQITITFNSLLLQQMKLQNRNKIFKKRENKESFEFSSAGCHSFFHFPSCYRYSDFCAIKLHLRQSKVFFLFFIKNFLLFFVVFCLFFIQFFLRVFFLFVGENALSLSCLEEAR